MLETFAGELAHRFPGMAGGVWRGSWSSFYDFTPDGNPVIDFVPGRANLITATGMSGHCFKLAPSLGPGHRRAGRRRQRAQLRLVGVRLRALRAPRRSRRRGSRPRMIGGVLLAAGAGSRFRAAGGGVKLLAQLDGRPLVERALAALAAAPLGDRVVVLGAHADELLAAIDLHGARAVRNDHWERGMASSLHAGLDGARSGLHGGASSCSATAPAWRPRPSAASRVAAEGAEGLVAATYGGGRQQPSRRDPARALGAAPARGRAGRARARRAGRARRLQRPAGAGRRRHAGRPAGVALPACGLLLPRRMSAPPATPATTITPAAINGSGRPPPLPVPLLIGLPSALASARSALSAESASPFGVGVLARVDAGPAPPAPSTAGTAR